MARLRITRRTALSSLGLVLASAGRPSVAVWTPQSPPPTDLKWPAPDPPAKLDPAAVRETLLTLHNQARTAEKLSRLEVSSRLQAAAQAHAQEMADRRDLSHSGADDSTVLDRVRKQGYRLRRCGENIAYGHYIPARLMAGWLVSRPHRKNILGGFAQIGVGYATATNGTPYWCVNFGLPARPR